MVTLLIPPGSRSKESNHYSGISWWISPERSRRLPTAGLKMRSWWISPEKSRRLPTAGFRMRSWWLSPERSRRFPTAGFKIERFKVLVGSRSKVLVRSSSPSVHIFLPSLSRPGFTLVLAKFHFGHAGIIEFLLIFG